VPKSHSGHVSDSHIGSSAIINANEGFSHQRKQIPYDSRPFPRNFANAFPQESPSRVGVSITLACRPKRRAIRIAQEFSEGLTAFARNVHGGRIPEYNLGSRQAASKSRPAK
jgi:hypothetical protein